MNDTYLIVIINWICLNTRINCNFLFIFNILLFTLKWIFTLLIYVLSSYIVFSYVLFDFTELAFVFNCFDLAKCIIFSAAVTFGYVTVSNKISEYQKTFLINKHDYRQIYTVYIYRQICVTVEKKVEIGEIIIITSLCSSEVMT